MQKERKSVDNSSKRHNHVKDVDMTTKRGPVRIDADELGVMLDEDLVNRLYTLEREREEVCAKGFDPRPWEEELAFTQREMQIRRVRRIAHTKYMNEFDADFARQEAGLPAGDFDNSAYVYAATNGRPRYN